jgi:DNA-binding transcriptional regulator YhcF (GntR family)
VNLNVQEWKVVSFINPKNTIRQIAKANRMNDLEIRRIVYGLLQAGLVEIVRPAGMPLPPQARQLPPVNKEQQASLVNRLINRIRSL